MPHRPLLLAATLLVGGCLGRVEVSQIETFRQGVAAQTAAQSPAQSTVPAAAPAKPRLWYVGIGLYDESWSENDVADLGARLVSKADGFQVVPLVFSNRTGAKAYPAASRANIDAATADIARQAKPGDVVLLYLSTHGARGLVARKETGGGVEPVGPAELRDWLRPLGDMRSVVVLSACFSGSLIPSLAAPNRIVMTAARADRASFGCQAGAEHTLYGQALLDALAEPHESLATVGEKVRTQVAGMERQMGISPRSEPQIVVGAGAAQLYGAAVF